MESFQKLRSSFKPIDYHVLNSRIKFGNNEQGEFKGIEYFDIKFDDDSFLYKIIPENYRKNFCATLMRINTQIPPHTDSGINVTINFYLETENCITQFYKFKNKPQKYQIQNQTSGFLFEEKDLIKTGSFIAEKNDVYVLDVSQPHSVYSEEVIKERIGLSLATNTYNYDEVILMLKETENL